MILNDKQIRELCVPPTAIVDYGRNDTDGTGSWAHSREPLDVIEEKVKNGKDGYVRYFPFALDLSENKYDMITPFVDRQVRYHYNPDPSKCERREVEGIVVYDQKIISYGLSSAGYDVRLAEDFKIFSNINSTVIDPLDFNETSLVDVNGEYCILPPNSYMLGRTVETFNIPDDVMVVCVGKSTYARAGAIINVTPIEPGFKGNVVIEISNSTPLPLKIYANMGIAQFLFFKASEPCEVSYAKRGGKYQGQSGITLPKG